MTDRRCPQCYRPRPAEEFLSDRPGAMCTGCREHYRPGYALRSWRDGPADQAPFRVHFARRSGNRKLGGLPASMSSPRTCPRSCPWRGAGCYAEYGPGGAWWRRVPELGLEWSGFLARVRALPSGQLWRHNVAGDLPGDGDDLDVTALEELADAAVLTRGFTFTRKPFAALPVRAAIAATNLIGGLCINVSVDTLAGADIVNARGLPVAVTVPRDFPARSSTPGEIPVVVCPAQYRAGFCCSDCGLCAEPIRPSVVAFRAHGQLMTRVEQQLRAKMDA